MPATTSRPRIGILGRYSPSAGALRYGAGAHDEAYDVDADQDTFDLALVRAALRRDIPLLAVCRGLHALNVALDGVHSSVFHSLVTASRTGARRSTT